AVRQFRQTFHDARDLIGEAFAAGWTVGTRLPPESPIGLAKLDFDFGVAAAGPLAELLLAQARLFDRRQAERMRGVKGAPRRAGKDRARVGQARAQFGEGFAVADIGRRVGIMDDAVRPRDRRVTDQPEALLAVHAPAP